MLANSRSIQTIVTLVLLYSSVCSATCNQNDGSGFYRGYWGVDLNETTIPNIIFDSDDPVQIAMAYEREMTIFFYLQPMIFNFYGALDDPSFTIKNNWKAAFDAAYGNYTSPKTPYNITGLTANAPNGFFLGSQLIMYGIDRKDLDSIANYIESKYPDAVISYDEHYNVFATNQISQIPQAIDLISISSFWPFVAGSINNEEDFYQMYINHIYPKSYGNQNFVWSIAMYNANNTGCVAEPNCNDFNACYTGIVFDTCTKVMLQMAIEAIGFMCHDRSCDDYPVTHTNKVVGLWAWHWNDIPDVLFYPSPPLSRGLFSYYAAWGQVGLRSIPALQSFEQVEVNNVCEVDLSLASSPSIIWGLTLLGLFLGLT